MEKERLWVHASRNANEGVLMFYDAICSYDGKSIQVPFKPDPNRPVYCHDHLIFVRDDQQVAALAHEASLRGEDRIQRRLNRGLKSKQRKESDQTQEEEWIFAHCSQ